MTREEAQARCDARNAEGGGQWFVQPDPEGGFRVVGVKGTGLPNRNAPLTETTRARPRPPHPPDPRPVVPPDVAGA